MAHLQVVTNPTDKFSIGDIKFAFCDCRILYVNAFHICSKIRGDRISGGYQRSDHLYRQSWVEKICKYKNTRKSKKVYERYDFETGKTVEISDRQNADGEYINLEVYIDNKLYWGKHFVYGLPGAEVWFSGQRKMTLAVVHSLWDSMEGYHSEVRVDHSFWNVSLPEMRSHLHFNVDDFTPDEGQVLMNRKLEDDDKNIVNPVVLLERACKIDYESMDEFSAKLAEIGDPLGISDYRREISLICSNCVVVK